jgi:putative transposase
MILLLPDQELVWQALSMRIRQLVHSTYQLQYHIVWGTKYRKKWLKDYVKKELISSLHKTIKKYPTLYLTTVNTDQDHVHLCLEVPPSIAIADAVKALKSHSSLHLRKRFKFIREVYLDKDGIWSVGYFVSSIGLNETQIKKYIEHQGKKEEPRTTTLFD